ncbi:hypothetical protein PRIPAC_77725, partial [Pristionchus pacificus]|uniref:Uncharacterized protein n=1 Tax=Pristionchus pacificus TaxID=54126 RepID=A0A2A6CKJ7_PRIPA
LGNLGDIIIFTYSYLLAVDGFLGPLLSPNQYSMTSSSTSYHINEIHSAISASVIMSNTTLFLFFNEYPILPIVVILASSSAFLPILFIIYIAQIAPLHSNCRFILCIWVLGASFVVNLGLVTLDLANETGYMPLTAFEPRKNHLRFFYLYLIIFRNSLHTISMVLDHGDFLILL